jgi:retron-type reverse transcriptase
VDQNNGPENLQARLQGWQAYLNNEAHGGQHSACKRKRNGTTEARDRVEKSIRADNKPRRANTSIQGRENKAVKANKGAPGVDGITVEAFGENLKRRDNPTERRSNHMDIPTTQPVSRVMIPKPGSTKERPLGIPCVRDRVVQYAMKAVLEPIYEKDFSDSSYGFRPKFKQQQALERAKALVQEGEEDKR